jgi:hypothetical protein
MAIATRAAADEERPALLADDRWIAIVAEADLPTQFADRRRDLHRLHRNLLLCRFHE